jgi:hypothetical protein
MLLISSCHWLTEMCENNAKWSNDVGIKFSRMPYEKHDLLLEHKKIKLLNKWNFVENKTDIWYVLKCSKFPHCLNTYN